MYFFHIGSICSTKVLPSILSFVFSSLLLIGCDSKKEESCSVSDSRIVGKWKLVQKCKSNGTIVTWEKTTENLVYNFSEKCISTEEGIINSMCTKGTFSFGQQKLNIAWTCSDGAFASGSFIYSFNSASDTLILRVEVDESSCGMKFAKQ
jgi:hypothetical protein